MNLANWLKRNAFYGFFRLFPLVLLASLADAALLYAIRAFMQILQKTADFTVLEWFLAALLLVFLRWVFSFLRGNAVERISRRIESGLSIWFIRRLRTLSPHFFHESSSENRLQVSYDAVKVVSSSAESLMQALQAVLQLVVFLPVLFYISPLLTAVLLLVVLPVISFVQKKLHSMKGSVEGEMQSRGEFRAEMENAKRFFRLWSSKEDLSRISESLFKRVKQVFVSGLSVGRRKVVLSQGMESLSLIAVLFVLAFCAWMISKGDLAPDGLVLYCSALFLCYKPVKECARLSPQIRMAKSSLAALFVLEKEPHKKNAKVADCDFLVFESVDFSYAHKVNVFLSKSVSLSSDMPILLLGPNGSGKSTFFKLISGLEEPDAGKIFLPKNFAGYGVFSVSQDLVLPPREFVLNRVKKELADKKFSAFVSLVQGEKLLKKQGLSGGERAKVALVWALASQARIVLLDEPFSFVAREERLPILLAFLDVAESKGKWVMLATHDALDDMALNHFQILNFPK
ncbi:MAG: ABC transporter ATP-binding protein/permease [Fibrobacteraceae bacterium]|nr:ABC transporter ATP-binding protein/permease [Fibrobacteraceae bacterium]